MKDRPKLVKPFLRWAGGKRWIAGQLAELIPTHGGTYYEPFLGSGALYFAALPNSAVLSDVNWRLIETYQMIKDNPLDVMAILEKWSNDERNYYRIREQEYVDIFHRAAQFIYLNKTCWNGLYRVNSQGKFNVPFANHGRPILDAHHLLEISWALRDAQLRCCDFEQILVQAGKGDFVYLDPPYVPSHTNKGFTKYNMRTFTWGDQERLGRAAVSLARKGCYVLVSNTSDEDVLELYPGFAHRAVSRHSILAAKAKFRRITSELLLASEPGLLRSFDH